MSQPRTAPSAPVHGPATPVRIRREGAARMRALRARQAAEGRPDPAAMERAIADALRDEIARTIVDGVARGPLDRDRIIVGIAEHLLAQRQRAEAAGKGAAPLRREAVSDAIYERLIRPRSA